MRPLPSQADRSPMRSSSASHTSHTPRCRHTRRRGTAALTAVVTAALAFTLAACGGASSPSRTGPTSTSASAPAAISDLVDHSAGLVVPASVHTATGADLAKTRTVVHTAQLIYTFWNTGDTTFLDQAGSPDFRYNTLPTGRPHGPAGPIAASAAFRTAIPDLTCQLADLYVTGDRFTPRLAF